LNPAKVGYGLTVFARVWRRGPDEETINPFVDAIMKLPEIVECHMLSGDCDFFC
jgi:DNA-binding Lrp family transcriptional regulator